MKKYNVKNYVRYKEDLKRSNGRIPIKNFIDYTPAELKIVFLPLVENIGRKFATSQEASGVMSINDIIQEGSFQLCKAVDKIDRLRLMQSEDIEQTLKSFLAKRIRGGIRREIDKNRGTMRIPEHKLNEIRKDGGKDKKMVAMFFNSIFLSIDANPSDENMVYQIPDKSDPYNETLLNPSESKEEFLKQVKCKYESFDLIDISYTKKLEREHYKKLVKQSEYDNYSMVD